MKLIIAEKPSVALAIAKALNIKGSRDGYIENGEYIISWCVGHLAAAAFPEEYDAKYSKWNYADLPIIPDNFKYKIYGDKQKQFNVVKSLMTGKDVSEVINACDAGRAYFPACLQYGELQKTYQKTLDFINGKCSNS